MNINKDIAIIDLILIAIAIAASVRILISCWNHVRIVCILYTYLSCKRQRLQVKTHAFHFYSAQKYQAIFGSKLTHKPMAGNINILVRFNFQLLLFLLLLIVLYPPSTLYTCTTDAANDVQCTKTQYLHGQSKVLSKAHARTRTSKLFIKTGFNGNTVLNYHIVANSCMHACILLHWRLALVRVCIQATAQTFEIRT